MKAAIRRILAMAFLGSCAFLGGATADVVSPRFTAPAIAGSSGGAPPDSAGELARLSDRFEEIARRVSPAVVYVEATKPARTASGKINPIEESGSGVLVRLENQSQTFVLTNNHVIAQAGAEQVTITAADGRLFKPARLWADPESDVALLRLDGSDPLPTAPLGNSDRARVGQWVLAIGSPFGLNQTVTHGIISARERG